jgi:predicted nucleotidyltransferase
MKPEVGRALLSAVDALDGLNIRYAVVGGLAVGAWGVNRSTRDADLYAELTEAVRVPVQRALEERGFHVPAMEEELERFGVFRSRSQGGVFVDIFSAAGPLGEAILDRRKRIEIAGRSLWLIAPEDLAILKAFSERPRDYEDLVNLSAVVGADLDVAEPPELLALPPRAHPERIHERRPRHAKDRDVRDAIPLEAVARKQAPQRIKPADRRPEEMAVAGDHRRQNRRVAATPVMAIPRAMVGEPALLGNAYPERKRRRRRVDRHQDHPRNHQGKNVDPQKAERAPAAGTH